MLPSLRRALGLAVIATALAPTGASAAVTKTTITTPAEPGVPALPTVREGRRGDAARGRVDATARRATSSTSPATGPRSCARSRSRSDGVFAAELPYKAFPRQLCTLRAVPNKYNGKDLDPFAGPLVAVTYFNPYETTTTVLGARTRRADGLQRRGRRTGAGRPT